LASNWQPPWQEIGNRCNHLSKNTPSSYRKLRCLVAQYLERYRLDNTMALVRRVDKDQYMIAVNFQDRVYRTFYIFSSRSLFCSVPFVEKSISQNQWRSHGGDWGLELLFVANVTLYLVTFIRIIQNLYFIYPI